MTPLVTILDPVLLHGTCMGVAVANIFMCRGVSATFWTGVLESAVSREWRGGAGVAGSSCIPWSSGLVCSWYLLGIVRMGDVGREIAFGTIRQRLSLFCQLVPDYVLL